MSGNNYNKLFYCAIALFMIFLLYYLFAGKDYEVKAKENFYKIPVLDGGEVTEYMRSHNYPVPQEKATERDDIMYHGLRTNRCSRSCCSSIATTSFDVKTDPYYCKYKDKLIGSADKCIDGMFNSGCLCLEKDQAENMAKRGGNAPSKMGACGDYSPLN